MNFKKQQLKGVEIHGAPQVGTRTVNILMGEHANEFVRGDIMDANAVLQAFDELKGNVDTNHDTLEELVNEIHANTDDIEVERNRAIAKENSIIDTKADKSALGNYVLTTALAEYAKKTDIPEVNTSDFVSKTTTDNQSIESRLNVSDELRVSNNTNSSNISLYAHDGAPALSIYAMSSNQYNASLTTRELRMSSTLNNLVITCNGIRSKDDNANHAFSTDGGVIDTTAFALKSELDSYAKKTDIPEVDTSGFVSKTTTDNQSIKSGLNVSNNLNVVDGNNEPLIDLSIDNSPYDTNTNSSIAVKSFFDGIVDGEQKYQKGGCMIKMVAGDRNNPYIIISTGTENSYTGENEIKITKSGIIQKSHMHEEDSEYYFAANGTINNIYSTSNKDIYRHFNDIDTSISNEGVFVSSYNNLTEETEGVIIKNSGISITNGNLNEVFATDGSIADLTQYVLKSIYDEKIAALESRIAALEANHTA